MKNVPSVIDGIEFLVNGQTKVSSVEVAENFDKEHKNILSSIQKMLENDKISRLDFQPSSYKSRGKEYPCFNMTRDGFSLLVMGFTGDKALEWKVRFLSAFNKMEQYIIEEEQRKLIRKQSAMNAPEMTDALLEHRAGLGKETKGYHYSNEFDMINRIVLGVSKKKWCEHEEIKKENFRDALTPVQIEAVENLQTANTVLIETGMEYKERKQKLENIFDKKFSKRCLDEIVRLNA